MEFRLPALGEGIDSATVTAVLVKPGETVAAGQNVVALETDKAAVEVPVASAGTIGQIHVKAGDKIPVGGLLLTLADGVSAEAPKEPATKGEQPTPTAAKSPEPQATASPAAPSTIEFTLPALGEGIEGGTVTAVMVKVGDTVVAGQNVVGIETDKAAVEVPVEVDGVVESIHVKSGEKVPVGGKLLTIATRTVAAGPASTPVSPPPVQAVMAGSNGTGHAGASRAAIAVPAENGTATRTIVPAGPATRRLARKLGVGLTEVKGSGRGGRVTVDDVEGFVRTERQRMKEGGVVGGSIVNAFVLPPLPDFTKFGPVELKEVAPIRQTIARNLTIGWRTMPMVTQYDLADITDLEGGRKRIVSGLPDKAPKITWSVLAVKAIVAVLKEFPHFNSSYDMNAGKLIVKKYYHVGMAVDTERGLVVPVIRDADKKSIRDLAVDVAALAAKAKAGKLTLEEMRGGTFTISNLGGIGGTYFTPIVNYPEVAILGLSRSSLQPVVKDGQIVPRLMLPLSLTYDHRVIDGADGARFTTRLVQLFSDPLRLLMET